jgi:hypothetical protein
MTNKRCLPRVFTLRLEKVHQYVVVPFVLALLGLPMAVPAASPKTPRIIQTYSTAETTISALVVWNTNVASDSRIQYSTTNPVPTSAPQMYSAAQVTYHEFSLVGLTPGTLYHYRVTSCTKRTCATATGSFETFPSCPDTVPPISGDWQRVASPNAIATLDNELLGIDAVSENDVWAVGWSHDPDGPAFAERTLIEHFDGNAWKIVTSPNPPNDTWTQLHAVSAVSANDVWAVGSSHDGTAPSRTLIEHWDGTEWRIVPSPSPDDQLNALLGVAAVSANDVWAVGYRSGTATQNPIDTLILHWDGIEWTQVASPNLGAGANQLFGITAISADDIWAVGFAGGAPLAMHWNGSAWTIVPVPGNSGLSTQYMTAVSAAASDDVWAVGQGRGFFSNRASAHIWHWDGARWTQKVCRAPSSSNPPERYEGEGGPDAYLTGVSATASNDVWAVGASGSGPMILHWDGAAWTTVTHPRAFPSSASLRAVTTLVGGSAWAAGIIREVDSSGSFSPERTLIHRYIP